MAANVESMFSVREVPWHGIGTVVQDAPTAADAIRLAGLDWLVQPRPLYCNNEQVRNKVGIIRRRLNPETDKKAIHDHATPTLVVSNATVGKGEESVPSEPSPVLEEIPPAPVTEEPQTKTAVKPATATASCPGGICPTQPGQPTQPVNYYGGRW